MTILESKSRFVVVILLTLHAGMLAWAATRFSPTVDETAHLPAGMTHWLYGRYELYAVNPPLVRMVAAIPVLFLDPELPQMAASDRPYMRREFPIARDFIKANGTSSMVLYTVGRWACIPFSLLGGYVCYRWAATIFGTKAGLFSLSLWCFSPTVLANAQMLTPDTGAAGLGIAAFYLFRCWLHRPNWDLTIVTGAALGLALLTKFTWVIVCLLWPAIWYFHWRRNRPTERNGESPVDRAPTTAESSQSFRRGAIQLTVIGIVALYVVNIFYAFDGSFRRLGDFEFVSYALGGSLDSPTSGNRFRGTVLGELPVPVPDNFVLGIDVQKRDFERGFRSYLLGEWKNGGWWYYYLVALIVKVPIGAWILLGLAVYVRCASSGRNERILDDVLLLGPAVTIFVLVSSQAGFSHHMRYVFPAFPFVFIWMSQVFAQPGRVLKKVSGAAWAWFVVSSLCYFPHSLSYFNEWTGGPRGGHRVLVDSNIDWGQGALLLKEWLDRHPEARPLGLAYFGGFDPRVLGLEFRLPPEGPTSADDLHRDHAELGPRPGWYAISVSTLRGHHYRLPTGTGDLNYIGREAFTYFQEFEPVATAGYSIYIYHLRRDEVNRVRERLGLSPFDATKTEIRDDEKK